MALSALLVFALALGVAAASPGPGIAALVSRVLTHGLRDVLPFLAAMWIGEVVWLTCAVAGLSVIARTFGLVFLCLKFAGVAYLLFLAWKMWFAPASDAQGRLPSGQSPLRMFVAGLTISASNPKIMVFYLALLPTLIDLSRVGVTAWLELTLTALTVLIAVDLAWALLAVRAKRLLSGRRASRLANRASAAVMAGAAAAIATR
ncbi:MAG: LysE family translocator [Pseudomonadota bacterium]|jgi:threonine/homoserine/homoserine lactone efflux protein|uniref:LysE family translocator n=1 Tax=Burkholderiaceae TaxID=119060 RepID=UPI0010F86A4E|nr:LysE family translocator [Burkholderia sp. 4M9327F10]